jgi:sulfatase modifying factor 1
MIRRVVLVVLLFGSVATCGGRLLVNPDGNSSDGNGANKVGVVTDMDLGDAGAAKDGGGDDASAADAAQGHSSSSSGALSVPGSVPPSCTAGGPGRTDCGSKKESCCTTLEVAGGSFFRTYDVDTNGGPTLPLNGGPTAEADPATVSAFRLDKYLVTVGRFRRFVEAWNGGSGWFPPAGSGKHTYLNGGQGLVSSAGGVYETAWIPSVYNRHVAPTSASLMCDSTNPNTFYTWTPAPGSHEDLPINCVNWYEAYAFCIWDGGFLPSAAELEYGAAGGSEQREYPWGSNDPGMNNEYAIYGCFYPSGAGECSGAANIAPVGAAPHGAGRWGQLDLAGDVFTWSLDIYAAYSSPCVDCARLAGGLDQLDFGGSFGDGKLSLLSSNRSDSPANSSGNVAGVRCARAP